MKPIAGIDDSFHECAHAAAELAKLGFSCVEFSNAIDFLGAVEKNNPFLPVFTDDRMPIMSGFQFCSHFTQHETGKHCPVILMLSSQAKPDQYFALRKGASGWVPKPIHAKALAKTIEAIPLLFSALEQRTIDLAASSAPRSTEIKRL